MFEWVTQILFTFTFILLCGPYFLRKFRSQWRYKTLLNQFPGPKPGLIVGSAAEYNIPREQMSSLYDRRFQQYGSAFRVWNLTNVEGDLFLAKPEYLEVILTSTKHIRKSSFYNRIHIWLGTGLLTSTGAKWHLHRKLITPAFHFKILEDFFSVFVEKSHTLVAKLRALPMDTEVDIMPVISRCTLDIICETAMGTQLNIQEDKKHELYIASVNELTELIVYREYRPWLYPDFIFFKTPSGKRFLQCLHVLHSFSEKVIQERKDLRMQEAKNRRQESPENIPFGYKRRFALLDLLLETRDGDHPLTDLEVREEVDTFMFEGHDTTAMAVTWTLYLLGRHPKVQDAVAEELKQIFSGNNHCCSMEDLTEMKYLERVIKESLRLYPSVPFIARRIEEELPLDENFTIPANMNIIIDVIHTHRLPEYYPFPDVFNPDNFLPENVRRRHPYAYIPFSAGPRNCIGQKFAMMELKTVISSIVLNFKLESMEEEPLRLEEMTLKPNNGLLVKLTPRKHQQT